MYTLIHLKEISKTKEFDKRDNDFKYKFILHFNNGLQMADVKLDAAKLQNVRTFSKTFLEQTGYFFSTSSISKLTWQNRIDELLQTAYEESVNQPKLYAVN